MKIANMIAASLLLFADNVSGADNLPPIPGSTMEWQRGELLMQQNKRDEGYIQMLAACDKNDAAGCYNIVELGYYQSEKFQTIRPNMQWLQIAEKTAGLLRQRCQPSQESNGVCEFYRTFLSNFRARLGDLTLQGGRLLAARCLAGRMGVEDCEDVEELIEGAAQIERDELAASVDKGYAGVCAAKNVNGCVRALFRIRYGNRVYPPARVQARFNIVAGACQAGHPNICAEYGSAVYEVYGKQEMQAVANAMGMACRLPPAPGEDDIKETACNNEKKLREQIASGS